MKSRFRLLSILVMVGLIGTLTVPVAFAGAGAEDIKNLYKGDNVIAHIQALTGIGPRVAGGPGEKAAAEYIAGEMKSYGLAVEIQEFPIDYYQELTPPVLDSYVAGVDFATMTYSGAGDVTAPLQAVDVQIPPLGTSTSGCETADFAGFVPGNIALMQRGVCTFYAKAANAEAAGAVGAIIFNEGNTPDRSGLLFGTLGAPGITIPVVGATFALGEALNAMPPGTLHHLKVDTVSYPSTSQNVIGTLTGLQPGQGIVYIGGHYDSVSAGVGANDDASGTAGMLEAARVLATNGHRTKATLKFIAFGAEEAGLVGSFEYVNANFDEVSTKGLGMINLDMIGTGDTLQIMNIDYGVPGTGGNQLRDYAEAKATAMGLTWEQVAAGENSDHTYFEQAGVPAAFLFESPDPYYHTAQDTLDKITPANLQQNGELATAVMYDWAKNPALRAKKDAKGLLQVYVYQDKVASGK